MAAEPGPLYEDTFSITSLNSEKYDRVARVTGTNANGDSYMSLDINSQLYPLATGDQVYILLSSTLSSDGTKDDGKAWREVSRGGSTLADHYEYVCHGKIYRFEDGENDNIKAFISFGGLLFCLDGPFKKLTPLRIDYVYLLMRKL